MTKQDILQELRELISKKFDCLEDGCKKKVTYWLEDDKIKVLIKEIEDDKIGIDKIEFETDDAYLTCNNGHTYEYPVKIVKKTEKKPYNVFKIKQGNVAAVAAVLAKNVVTIKK